MRLRLNRVRPLMCALLTTVALALAVVLGGCGSGTQQVVARVGHTTVTKQTLEHWMSVEAAEGVSTQAAQRQRALSFLLGGAWLIEQAAGSKHPVFQGEVSKRLASALAEYPGGIAEQRTLLAGSGRTEADLKLETQLALASSHLREPLQLSDPKVTSAEVDAYYRKHPSSFVIPEWRYFNIDNLRSNAQALKVKRGAVAPSQSFAHRALHEDLPREPRSRQDPIEQAIFAAKPNVVTGPIQLKVIYHSLFAVRRIVPASRRPLAQVQATISDRLTAAQGQQALARLQESIRGRWLSVTHCLAGYVVQQCSEYKGPRTTEELFQLK
jgi:hypothetical protein